MFAKIDNGYKYSVKITQENYFKCLALSEAYYLNSCYHFKFFNYNNNT